MVHARCLRRWLSSNPTCPLCRANVATPGALQILHVDGEWVDEEQPAAPVQPPQVNMNPLPAADPPPFTEQDLRVLRMLTSLHGFR